MGKKKKKFKKSFKKNIRKLEKELYENNKYVSREEFIISKFSKRIRKYYETLSEDRKKSFLKYIMNQEDYERKNSLEKYAEVKDNNEDQYEMKVCRTLAEVIKELKKKKKFEKKRKKKIKHVLKGSKGVLYLLNPEAYDQIGLSKKEYRKILKRLAKNDNENTSVELDCTLKDFYDKLMKNESVNEEVMNAFWGKDGFVNLHGY